MQNQQEFEEPQETNLYVAPDSQKQSLLLMRNMEDARVEALLSVARKEAETYYRSRRNTRMFKIFCGNIMGLMLLSWLWNGALKGQWDMNFVSMSYLFTCFGAVAVSQNHKTAIIKLMEFDDVRAVGPLTDMLESNDKEMIAMTRNALIRLLPKLQFSDAHLLSPEQRDILNRALPKVITSQDRAMSLAILKAYEQVGDERTALAITQFAEGPVAAYDRELRQAAQDCLPYLRASIARRKESAMLLRASQPEDARPETLLRPASGPTDAGTEHLLRPAE